MIIQILVTALAVFALFGVVRRFKTGAVSKSGLIIWILLWAAAGALVWVPQATNRLAGFLGVGRGADAVFYIAIVLLFYLLFRVHGRIEQLEHQLNELVKKIALKDIDEDN
ncbi:DUF2304 family protein [Candidatus Uhrbacteria bacterium]|nr:DUF2304 family protein [Candidatus Uhrbacteria bacterium]